MNNAFFKPYLIVVAFFTGSMIKAGPPSISWTMNNTTRHNIIVQVELKGNTTPFYYFVRPKEDAYFSFSFPFAYLGKINYIVLDKKTENELREKKIIKYPSSNELNHKRTGEMNNKEMRTYLDSHGSIRKVGHFLIGEEKDFGPNRRTDLGKPRIHSTIWTNLTYSDIKIVENGRSENPRDVELVFITQDKKPLFRE